MSMHRSLFTGTASCMQDPHDRSTARELLQDPWLVSSTKTLKMSWNRTAGLVRRGLKKPSDAHKTLASVMQRMMDHSGAHPSQPAGAPKGPSHVASDLTAPEQTARKPLQEFPSRSFRERLQSGSSGTGQADAAAASSPQQQGWDDTAKRNSCPAEDGTPEQV